jgi:hypothetical protein
LATLIRTARRRTGLTPATPRSSSEPTAKLIFEILNEIFRNARQVSSVIQIAI